MKLDTNYKYSQCESVLLKQCSGSKVKGQGHDHTECHNGGGMHFDGVASRLTCFCILVIFSFCATDVTIDGYFCRK